MNSKEKALYVTFSNSENGTMCAVKEVKVIKDDQTSKECLKQLNQVGLVFTKSQCLKTSVSFTAMFGGY